MILGLTGGIASGKSTVSRLLEGMGAEIVDADKIAREITERKEVVDKLVEIFGEKILEENNSDDKQGIERIDRKKLREVVFKKKDNIRIINSIIHPKVIAIFEDRRKSSHPNEIIIFDIPLLFEAKLEYLCDKVIVVATDKKTQIERIKKRDGSSAETAKNIIDNQMSSDEKKERADYLIENDKGLAELKEQVVGLYEKVKEELDR